MIDEEYLALVGETVQNNFINFNGHHFWYLTGKMSDKLFFMNLLSRRTVGHSVLHVSVFNSYCNDPFAINHNYYHI